MKTSARRSAAQKTVLSLPKDVYARLEALRLETGDTLSGLIRRALEEFFENLHRRDKAGRYVVGYRRFPETRDEVRAAATVAKQLAKEPWERSAARSGGRTWRRRRVGGRCCSSAGTRRMS